MSGYHKRDFETFPVHTLKRVDRPTTIIHDDQVQRVDERESGFNKAVRGDYGPVLQRERARFVPKQPISGALSWRTAEAFNGRDWISNSMSFLAYSTSGFITCLTRKVSMEYCESPPEEVID